jgi:mannosyltransferase
VSTAAVGRRATRGLTAVLPAVGVGAAIAFLLARTVSDVHGKPWQEDEAVAGLIAARPFGEMLHTVVVERAGAPLHFVLAHLAFAFEGSPETLRWLSLVFAVGTIPLCYDLARRLFGAFAGVVAATLVSTSPLLTTYATFGRMYSLFACTNALALDLFVRATQRPTRGTLAVAGAAALLPVLVHPFGVFLFGAELTIALWLWRWRAFPVALMGLALALPYLRLSGRYGPDAGMSAPDAALSALGGPALAVFAAPAAIGAWTLPRRIAPLAPLLLVAPLVVLAVASSDELSPRHLVFMLPMWTTLVAAGVARLPRRAAVAAATVTVAALTPSAVADPRTGPADVADAAAWLRSHVRDGDVLYPYSPVFLAALPQASRARALPREPVALARALKHLHHVRRVLIAIPRERLPGGHVFHSWLILEHRGSFAGVPGTLARTAPLLKGTSSYAAVLQLYATSTEGTSPQRSSSR